MAKSQKMRTTRKLKKPTVLTGVAALKDMRAKYGKQKPYSPGKKPKKSLFVKSQPPHN